MFVFRKEGLQVLWVLKVIYNLMCVSEWLPERRSLISCIQVTNVLLLIK